MPKASDRFEANYLAEPSLILEKVGDFLEENGFPKWLVIARHGPVRVRLIETPTRHELSLIINPEPGDEFGGYEVFRIVLLVLTPSAGENSSVPTVNVTAYSHDSEYDHLVSGLEESFRVTFPVVVMNDVGTDNARVYDAPVMDEPLLIAESSNDTVDTVLIVEDAITDKDPSVAETPQPVHPIPVEDPTDQRILKIVQEEPDLTDAELGRRIGIRRQNANRRRKGLEKMGYKVR